MKIFIVGYWLPFPSSEYGGMQVVIAADEQDAVNILVEGEGEEGEGWKEWYKDYRERIAKAVAKAKVFEIVEGERGLVRQFIT